MVSGADISVYHYSIILAGIKYLAQNMAAYLHITQQKMAPNSTDWMRFLLPNEQLSAKGLRQQS